MVTTAFVPRIKRRNEWGIETREQYEGKERDKSGQGILVEKL
jgi:hypothetical protein